MTIISDILEKFYSDHEVQPYISPERLGSLAVGSKARFEEKHGAPVR